MSVRRFVMGTVLTASLAVPAVAIGASAGSVHVGYGSNVCPYFRWQFVAGNGEVNNLAMTATPALRDGSDGGSIGVNCEWPGAIVETPGQATFVDANNRISGGAGCVSLGRAATCHGGSLASGGAGLAGPTGVWEVDALVVLGDMDDTADVSAIRIYGRVFVFGGEGNDTIVSAGLDEVVVDCGPGIDTVHADSNDEVSANCENVTVY